MLTGKPKAYVGGQLRSAQVLADLHRRDFVYDIAVDPSSRHAAFSHLAAKVFRLNIYGGTSTNGDLLVPPIQELSDGEINPNEFDVEAVCFLPDGQHIASVSYDHQVRLFDLTGKVVASYATEEKLDSVACSPDGKFVVAGSEHGLLTVLSANDLSFGSDLRAHGDMVRALAFADDGTLWSGSWDKQVRSYSLATEPKQITEVRIHYERPNSLTTLHALIDGKAAVELAVDKRSPNITLSPDAARRAGIDVSFAKDHIQQMSPAGMIELPLIHDQTLQFKNLTLQHIDVVVCQNCQPQGIDGLLGQNFLEAYELVLNEANQEVVLRLKDPSQAQTLNVPTLKVKATWPMPGFVQDLTVDRSGDRLGVAIGETRAERSLALYKREKAGDVEPEAAGNFGAIIDAKSGQVVERHGEHHGIVSTAAISPDGHSLATGGWDKSLFLYSGSDQPAATFRYGWSVRKVRFSLDGRLLAVAAWTPQNAQNSDSDPSAQLIRLFYVSPEVKEVH